MRAFLQRMAVVGALLAAVITGAAAQVFYDVNSWEAVGSPAFVVGPLCDTSLFVPYQQDGWTELTPGLDGINNPITLATLLGTTTVSPASGTQMHRSMSSTMGFNHFVWKDLGAAYSGRTAGNNTIVVRTDIYLPSFYATSDHEHGITCWDPPGAVFLGGFTTINLDRSFILYGGGTINGIGGAYIPGVISRDTWTRVLTVLDYNNNQVECYINNKQVVFALEADNIFRSGWPMDDSPATMAPFNDADFTSFPSATPTSSSIFTDNFRVSAVRSITFNGKVHLSGVPTFADAVGSVYAILELRDSAGNIRTGQQALRLITPDAGDASAGTYSVRIHDVPDGSYKLYIKGLRHLSRLVNVTVSGSGAVTVPTVTLLGGDSNGDDAVDVLDLDALIQSFDTVEGDVNFNAGADFDYTGSIDVLDLDLLIQHFDLVGEGA